MTRICTKRDAICPHGMSCPYVDGYNCTEPVGTCPSPVDEPVAWATVRVEDTCDGLLIHADDARKWGLISDHPYEGHFLPDGRYKIALTAQLQVTEARAKSDTVAALEAERDEAQRDVAEMKAGWDSAIQQMSERFRAVNVEHVAKLTNQDLAVWCQENAARANAAESALAAANARVERLEKALREIRDGCEGRVLHGSKACLIARAALTGGEDETP